MGLFDFLRKGKQEDDRKPEKEVIISVSSHQAEMLKQNKPVISHGSIDAPPDLCAGRFSFVDVPIAENKRSGGKWYLLSGDNAAAFAKDIPYINEIIEDAAVFVPGVPDFQLKREEIAFEPFPVVRNAPVWHFCKLFVDPYTPTGKLKKYPVRVSFEDTTGYKSGCFEYDADGVPSKGYINVFTDSYKAYHADYIGGVLAHVIETDNAGKTVLYNKNE